MVNMRCLKVLYTVYFGVLTTAAFAQTGKPVRFSAKLAGTVNLKEVEDKYNAQVHSIEMPNIEGKKEAMELKAIKQQSALLYPRKNYTSVNKTTAATAPLLGTHFVADSNSGIPPDNYMAISAGKKAVSVINQTIAVHDGTTGNYLYRTSLKFFSAAVGLNNTFTDYRFDPKVIYDPQADRFICVMLNGINGSNYIVIGFSKTNDPVAGWNFYKFYGNYAADTSWFDYPAISITQKEFFLTGNKIKFDSSWQAGFHQTLIYQINKQDGYNGDSVLDYQIWDSISYGGRNIRCLHPVKSGEAIGGPAQYFLSNRNFDITNDTVFLVKIPDTIGGSTTLSITPLVSSLAYGVPPTGRQPDTSVVLETNDGRILGGYIKDDQIQFVSTTVHPASGAAGIYHGIINNVSSTPSVTGSIYAIDSLDMGYPNISYTGTSGGNYKSIISFNYTGPRTYPSLGAIYFDGSAYSNITVVKAGDSSIKVLMGKSQRWGDYTGSQPQWGSTGIVWIEGIFGRTKKTYGNYMAQLISPEYNSVSEIVKTPSINVFPNPAWAFISVDFSLQNSQVVSFSILDVNGKLVDNVLSQYCKEGKNMLQFNIASLASGTYFLKIMGTDGMSITHSFVRN